MSLLITGGTGYIGSHTVVELLSIGEDVIIVDNLANSSTLVLDRIEAITGKRPTFIEADICDENAMNAVFSDNNITAVVHFAGLKAVGESNTIPLSYYHNNVAGTITLLEIMAKHNVKNFVFSSSATVYGDRNVAPMVETMETRATNPYGQTKLDDEILTEEFELN